ncbi:MAG: N-acetylmuramoyl-L-alanine amidase [Melioribacteraceae bacterium]|nr:N-acetylmuramoyl-L-alanine amidase [Melioribacteraceae bacterium]
MKFRYIFVILYILSISLTAQRYDGITVELNGKKEKLSFVDRKGSEYVSLKELAGIFGAGYYYNPQNEKAEIKFPEYRVKFTARNQFVVLTDRTGYNPTVYQLPISTVIIDNDVFIPLPYTAKYLSFGLGKNLDFNSGTKSLTYSGESFASGNMLDKNKKYGADYRATGSDKYDIYGIEVAEKANGTLVRFRMTDLKFKPPTSIRNDILYIFLSGIEVDPTVFNKFKSAGLIKSIAIKNVDGQQQLELKLKKGYASHESFIDESSKDFFITIHNDKLITDQKPVGVEREKWNFDVIVIDAGHGGKDPGAIGIGGIKEKDINLGVALKLGKMIKETMTDVKIVYTRSDDSFVDLYKRGKIANENNGKLFISIHCNSLPRRDENTRGFEVYLLRPGRTDEAIKIAEKENSVIEFEDNPQRYEELTEENFILVSMAHSAYMRYSEHFSDLLNQNWKKNVEIPSRGIKQAGFLVLVGASMPSVLIENGFLTNSKDARYMASSKGQASIAKAIYQSVVSFKNYYDKILDEES